MFLCLCGAAVSLLLLVAAARPAAGPLRSAGSGLPRFAVAVIVLQHRATGAQGALIESTP